MNIDQQTTSALPVPGLSRWRVPLLGIFLQLCLGSVYAWSFFQNPLVEQTGWQHGQVTWAFSLTIFCLGLGAALAGMQLPRLGPRRLALSGAVLYSGGYLLAGLALEKGSLLLFYLGYGVLGGTGLGLCYVTPVATAVRWIPERKGLVSGLVIMGFGVGALIMSKWVAPWLMQLHAGDLSKVFSSIGWLLLLCCGLCSLGMRNPPERIATVPAPSSFTDVRSVLQSKAFIGLWLIFFINISVGLMLIAFQSPLIQALLRASEPQLAEADLLSAGALLIAVSALCNGMGRLFWAVLSDRIGRLRVFRILLSTQILAFLVLSQVQDPLLFAALTCYVLFCYGGGFGSIPAFASDIFGSSRLPFVYGYLLSAWSIGGLFGPQLVAWLLDRAPQQATAISFILAALLLVLGLLCSKLLNQGSTEGRL